MCTVNIGSVIIYYIHSVLCSMSLTFDPSNQRWTRPYNVYSMQVRIKMTILYCSWKLKLKIFLFINRKKYACFIWRRFHETKRIFLYKNWDLNNISFSGRFLSCLLLYTPNTGKDGGAMLLTQKSLAIYRHQCALCPMT